MVRVEEWDFQLDVFSGGSERYGELLPKILDDEDQKWRMEHLCGVWCVRCERRNQPPNQLASSSRSCAFTRNASLNVPGSTHCC